MPRKARIDAAGAIHHIIARGIDGLPIFQHHRDRTDFLRRLGSIIKETKTACYAWALMPNHFHLLLRTGEAPLPLIMIRLLTGYAVGYNRRYGRSGHLFGNRYKSILCQEDPYFLELVRYIHLNPLRAGVIDSMDSLNAYPFCGHAVLMGRERNDWQQTETVLSLFSADPIRARGLYGRFIEEAIASGSRPDLIGGTLARSDAGWESVPKGREGLFRKWDERILGDPDFVEEILRRAEEQMEGRCRAKAKGFDFDRVTEKVCRATGLEEWELYGASKEKRRVQARALLCYWAAREAGITQVELARRLKMSPAAISFSVRRGEKLARERGYALIQMEVEKG